MGRVGEGGRALLVSVQHEQEEGGVARFRREGGRGLDEGGRGIVGVVEDEQGRQLALLRGADRLQGGVGGSGAPGVEDRRPGALNLGGELGGETGLADAFWAADERNPGAPALGLRPALAQPAQLALAPGEERRAALELSAAAPAVGDGRRGRGRGEGWPPAARAARGRARPRSPGPAPDARRDMPRSPRTAVQRGRGRACAAHGSARGGGARRSAP